MRMWIDTEFNSFGGELISLALVAEDGAEFYRSLGCDDPHPWVAEHVMPIIGIEPVSRRQMQYDLQHFIGKYKAIHVIADWPDDLRFLCEAFITGPGERIAYPPITMEIDQNLEGESALPHNALADARGNMVAWQANNGGTCIAERLISRFAAIAMTGEKPRAHTISQAELDQLRSENTHWAKSCFMTYGPGQYWLDGVQLIVAEGLSMSGPRPGATLLFIGGVCDGERRVVVDPPAYLRAFPLPSCSGVIDDDPTYRYETVPLSTYRLHRIPSKDGTLFYYAEQSMTGHEAVMAMVRGYRGEADGRSD